MAPSVWVSHFNGLYQLHESFKERVAKLEKKLDNLEKKVCFNNLDKLITEKEISFAISKLRCNKSPGLDNISNNMIKHSQNVLLSSLSKIFNSCLSHGLYPRNWTEGYITVLHKSGEVTDPNNYRGLTITNAIGKLFNSILNIRLDSFLEENNVINDCQIGFTRKARTSDHMFVLKSIFDKYCNTKDERVFACFVDFHKAFDKVIHTGIRIKLLEIGVSSRFYSVIKNMYLETRSCIKIHDKITEFFQTKLGVKQGDNLSPNLFKIFINSLPDYFTRTRDPIMLDGKLINCLMYADDIVILSNSAEGLQEKLNELHNFCNDWCLDINTKKTKVLIFNKAGRHISQKFIFNKDELECVSNYKYLGIQFNASCSFSYAQNDLYQRALKAYFKLCNDFLVHNPTVKNAIHVFDHTIKPILLYGCEIWGYFNPFTARLKKENISVDTIYSRILCEKLHIKFCKYILGVNRKSTNFAVLSELGRFPLHYDIVKHVLGYWHRLENIGSSFPLLKAAYNCSKKLFETKKTSWYGSINILREKMSGIEKHLPEKYSTFKLHCGQIVKGYYTAL